MKSKQWKWFHSVVVVLLSIALALLAIYIHNYTSLCAWWMIMGIVAGAILIIGHGVTGVWRGAFIDERNVISLSRFQLLAWTVLILSAFMTAAFWNVGLSTIPQPLDEIKLDPTLWMLMGISTASLVASPLLLSSKKAQTPNVAEMQQTFELLKQQGDDQVSNQGLVVTNTDIGNARWSDMFTGEETGNAARMDLSRLQMFFFTLVALLTYGVTLGGMFRDPVFIGAGFGPFPMLSEGLLALIGISHTGYLAAKGLSNSQTGDTGVPAGAPVATPDSDNDQPAMG